MLPASKSNRITVDDERYQYVVTEAGATDNDVVPLAVTVQHHQNGARLRVIGLTASRVPEDQSKFSMGRTVEPNVEPRHVVLLIRLATSRGWAPTSPGPPFILRVTKSDVLPVVPRLDLDSES
jgi:hypothetical protein